MTFNSTATSRIFSASVANWVGIGISLFTQIVFVPIFLNHWSVETYGVWLLILTFLTFARLFHEAHRDFIYHEGLKHGKDNIDKVCLQLFSALPIVFLVSFLSFIVVYLQFEFKFIDTTFGLSTELQEPFLFSILLLTFVLFVPGQYFGFLKGPLILLGYLPYFTWINAGMAFANSITPILIVIYGGELVDAVIGLAVTTALVNLLVIYLVLNLYKKEGLKLLKPNYKLGLSNFVNSFWVLAKHTSDTIRHVGIRFLLLNYVSATAVTQFATNRTVVNIAKQGMSSLTGPILPEMMRYMHDKKELEIKATIALLWLLLCFFIAPCLIILQLNIGPLFEIWTAGAVDFDPKLFSLFSSSILMMILGQPASGILSGNNLFKVQLLISLIAVSGLLITIYSFYESLGILSAGLSLLVAETIVMIFSVWKAYDLMIKKNLNWPWQYFLLSFFSVCLTIFCLLAIAHGLATKVLITFVFLLQSTIAITFWKLMPALAKEKFYKLLNRFRIRK